jgi:hypothetical protein
MCFSCINESSIDRLRERYYDHEELQGAIEAKNDDVLVLNGVGKGHRSKAFQRHLHESSTMVHSCQAMAPLRFESALCPYEDKARESPTMADSRRPVKRSRKKFSGTTIIPAPSLQGVLIDFDD